MKRRMYACTVLGAFSAAMIGCQWGDIGSPDERAIRQEQMRRNRGIPTAAQMPPGLGEDLPLIQPPAQSVSVDK